MSSSSLRSSKRLRYGCHSANRSIDARFRAWRVSEVEVLVMDDQLNAEERAELHASLDRALDDSEASRGMDAWEYLAQYRARREARTA